MIDLHLEGQIAERVIQITERENWENLKTNCTVNAIKGLFFFICNSDIVYLYFKKIPFLLNIF
jgi:hypothetical protein